mgnify:CR=1 FL=1
MKDVLQPAISDIKSLESNGIDIESPYGNINVKATISTLVADNLGSHEMSGFTECFSGKKPCRFCCVSRDNLKDFTLCNHVLRNQESFEEMLSTVQDNPNLSVAYGVKRNSPLNDLEYFKACWGSPSDIAQDILMLPLSVLLNLFHLVPTNQSGYS